MKREPSATIVHGPNLAALAAMADNSVDSIVTDPPYGLGKEPDPLQVLTDWLKDGYHEITTKAGGFMGKEWDSFVPQPRLWREIFRVLKPGGYLVAFFGTRTYDWGVMALRLGGFEIRDQLAWIYGSGFPKTQDVSRLIDAADGPLRQRERQLQFTAWLRDTGLKAAEINKATGSFMAGHYLTDGEQPAVPTREHFERIRALFPLDLDVPEWVEQMVDERSPGSANLKKRKPKKVAIVDKTAFSAIGEESTAGFRMKTKPHTEKAQAYEGWGTALKPAQEPIVLARKPLQGSTAENVLEFGTGALNIAGCRIPVEGEPLPSGSARRPFKSNGYNPDKDYGDNTTTDELGRFPSNILHDGSEEALDMFAQAGNRGGKSAAVPGKNNSPLFKRWNQGAPSFPGDQGTAARFFYCAKASRSERNLGLNNPGPQFKHGATLREIERTDKKPLSNNHPTVKPLAVMTWLVRMVTPPGGVVLDPFAGSGTTGAAAILEGFDVILLEREAEYIPLIEGRTEWAKAQIQERGISGADLLKQLMQEEENA